jgi:fructoselysine-6-P-deglycase FrlB-like protein
VFDSGRKVARMRAIEREVASQPDCWERAAALAKERSGDLPSVGERVLVLGCGTSFYMAQSYARAREDAGLGETDALVASELTGRRSYDRVVALSRSGTTTEVIRALASIGDAAPTVAVTAVEGTPVPAAADRAIVLGFADEEAVVQTRFATTALALFLASLGLDLAPAIADARAVVDAPAADEPVEARSFAFLGTGWTIGLANEAALKMREAALAWAEAYPAFEYRHGPMSLAGPDTVVWPLEPLDPDLERDVAATGASIVRRGLHPLAELVAIQRLAIALAERKGLDPDHPRHLSRSVVLPG